MGRSSRSDLTAAAGPPRSWIVAIMAENDSISDIRIFIDFLADAKIFTWIKPHCPELSCIYFVLR